MQLTGLADSGVNVLPVVAACGVETRVAAVRLARYLDGCDWSLIVLGASVDTIRAIPDVVGGRAPCRGKLV